MPRITSMQSADEMKAKGGSTNIDLGPYLSVLETIVAAGNVSAVLDLDENESQRAAKRRFTNAAKQGGYTVGWRKAPSDTQLKVLVVLAGNKLPGSRVRKPKAAAAAVTPEVTPEVPEVSVAPAGATSGRRQRETAAV
jgi:hypothetical protein